MLIAMLVLPAPTPATRCLYGQLYCAYSHWCLVLGLLRLFNFEGEVADLHRGSSKLFHRNAPLGLGLDLLRGSLSGLFGMLFQTLLLLAASRSVRRGVFSGLTDIDAGATIHILVVRWC